MSLLSGEALRPAFEEHYEPLVRLCALLAADPGVAEALAREAFVRVASQIGELPNEMVAAALRRMAFNRWNSRFRRWSMVRRA